MNESLQAIGERLRGLRVSRGWTQEELAERIGANRSDISNVEAGRRKPSRNMLEALRGRLGVSADWLLFGEGDAPGVEQVKRAKIDAMLGLGGAARRGGGAMMMRENNQSYGVAKAKADEPATKSRWGYLERETAEDVRVRVLMDSGLRGTNLERLVMDESNWDLMAPLRGDEMEYLREYCEAGGDPPMSSYVAVLDFLRRVGLGRRG